MIRRNSTSDTRDRRSGTADLRLSAMLRIPNDQPCLHPSCSVQRSPGAAGRGVRRLTRGSNTICGTRLLIDVIALCHDVQVAPSVFAVQLDAAQIATSVRAPHIGNADAPVGGSVIGRRKHQGRSRPPAECGQYAWSAWPALREKGGSRPLRRIAQL